MLAMHRFISLCFALFVGASIAVSAEPTPQPSRPSPPIAESTPPPAARLSPDNPGAFNPAAATTAWLDTVSADKRAKSNAYFEGGYWLILWDFLLGATILLFLLYSGISARLRDFAEGFTRFKAMQVVVYAIPFVIILTLLTFPLTVY